MKKYFLLALLFVLLPSFSLVALAYPEKNNTVNLRQPPQVNKAQYVKEVLFYAYTSIGYTINWIAASGNHELTLVKKGKLTAALARASAIEQEFPSLIKVPFKLLDFKLLKISDRRRCGYCLDEDINSIIYAKGSMISEKYVNSLRTSMDKLAIIHPQKLNEMILRKRVDSALVMDFQLSEEADETPHLIIETIAHEYDFHYLSAKHAHLKKPLLNAFNQLEQNGTLAKLKAKYQITKSHASTLPKTNKISFISANWLGYTNLDGSGIYWNIIDEVFSSAYKLEKNSMTWVNAVQAFEQNQIDVLVGAYRSEKLSNALFSSYHIDYEYPLYVFTREQATLARFKAKDSKLVACLNSGTALNKHVNFLADKNIVRAEVKQCQRLMKQGKVDVVIAYDYYLDAETKMLAKLMLVEYSPLFVVFHNTPQGYALKEYFDQRIKKLAGDDVLATLFPDNITYQQAHIRP